LCRGFHHRDIRRVHNYGYRGVRLGLDRRQNKDVDTATTAIMKVVMSRLPEETPKLPKDMYDKYCGKNMATITAYQYGQIEGKRQYVIDLKKELKEGGTNE